MKSGVQRLWSRFLVWLGVGWHKDTWPFDMVWPERQSPLRAIHEVTLVTGVVHAVIPEPPVKR